MSLRGYCRTLSEEIACKPAIKMTRLTTSARTGRRMKRSVKVFTGGESTVGRFRRELGFRRELVIDDDVHAVAQLEDPRAHDQLVHFHAVRDCDKVAARFASANKGLAQGQALSLCFFIG